MNPTEHAAMTTTTDPTDPAATPYHVHIPGCRTPGELRFAYLNLADHPRGVLMLQRLVAAGCVPTLVIDEESALADSGRASQRAELDQVPGYEPPPLTEDLCSAHGVPRYTVPHHNDKKVAHLIQEADVHIAVLGDTRILKPFVIDSAPHGIVNVHPGFLPEVRGNNPYIWSVIHNLPQGATAHFIDPGVDRGPILLARRIELPDGTDLPQLVHTLNDLCADIVVDALHRLASGEATATPQPDDPRLTFREARPEVRALAAKMLRERAERAEQGAIRP
ncbi:formyltransferase family protein [Streptomyces natalensis]|uniref:formyltransferase family protein n=1 Tax=Streptomyces natalensis TaxID=68242 RepID=UPI0004AAFE32|nr:formyltransferase family protein [Streptomyces natalensis]